MTNFWCWFYKKYILVFCILLILLTMGAFLAPVLANRGINIAARIIYSFYRISCHQLAYRTWFLFGEQDYYPLQMAGIPNVISYEEMSGNMAVDARAAQDFIGSIKVGYKTALCQRDLAILVGIIFAGFGFTLSKRKWEAIPILYWIILGVVPLFLDGSVQWIHNILSVSRGCWSWESTPLLRTATGFLFGFTTGLFLFPKLEQSLWITKNNHNCRE